MKKLFKGIIYVIILFNLLTHAFSMDSHKFAFMNVNMGARANGLSGAFTALADDSMSVYYNPAGLANLKMIEFNANYDMWFMDSSLSYGCFNIPIGYGNIGGLFLYTGYGEFEERDETGRSLDTKIEPYSLSGGLFYGFPIGNFFSAGLGIKFSNFMISDYSLSSMFFDLGVKANFNNFIFLGLTLQNMDFEFSDNFNLNGGIGINVFNINNNKMAIDFDIKYSGIYGPSYSIGTEIQLFKLAAIRAGYDINNENRILGG
ncbi:MAG TPA: UPF0164 family protein, partial [Candidatus Goldiibacteriota bacterium]|nr:UPF0164 family protein [Candidatus Goldiibacteriota bacterium]